MGKEFLHDLNIHGAGQIQFKTAAGANAGKIDQDGNNLVLTNAVGDILLGDGSSDVFIGDGTNNVDVIFEQSGSIKGDGTAVTLTLGGSNTTLNLESPNISGNLSIGATAINNKLTFTTANGYILFDYEPPGDTGEYSTETPLIKVDLNGSESVILSRISEYRAVVLGIDDTVWLRAGDTGSVIKTNVNLAAEVVLMSAEGGFHAYGFPGNDTTWSNRNEFKFYSADTTAANNGLYIGDGGSTQFIDLSRNLTVNNITSSGAITSGMHTITKTSTHVAQGTFSATDSHLDLYNNWASNTDQKGSILTFTDNYYDGSSYHKTTRSAIKGGTDTVGNTADGYLEFYTDSGGANTPTLALRLDKNQAATFAGSLTMPNYIIHDGDTDTQFGFSGANTFIVHTGGSDRFSITGDVGVVGTTDFFIPQGRKLLLDGAGGHTYIEEESDSNLKFYVAASERLNITNTNATFAGDVNVNTAAANGASIRLIHPGSSENPEIRIQSGESGTTAFSIYNTATAPDAEQFFINNTLGSSHLGNKRGALKLESSSGVILTLNGNATFSGHVKIAGSKYLEFAAMGKLINMDVPTWGTGAQEHNLLYSGWTSSTGDYLSIKVAGNSTADHGNLIIGDNGLWFGRMNATNSAQATDSSTNPNGNSNYFRVDSSGNGTFAGTISNTGDVTITNGNVIFSSQYGVRFNDANTRIYTNTDNPEDLLVEADQDILLTPDRYVGVNTTSPASVLHVNTGSGTNTANTVIIDRAGSSDYSAISFATAGTVNWSVGQNSDGTFEVYEDGQDAKTRLTIAGGGNATFAGQINTPSALINTTAGGEGLRVYTTDASTAPNVKFGRNSGEYIGFKVTDRNNGIVFRQDETSGNHEATFNLWSSASGNKAFVFKVADNAGANEATWLTIENTNATFAGDVTLNPTSTSNNAAPHKLIFKGTDYQGNTDTYGQIGFEDDGNLPQDGSNFYIKGVGDNGSLYNIMTSDGYGQITFNSNVTSGASIVATSFSGNITKSGDFTVDVAGDIILDADGADIKLKDGGTEFGRISNSSSSLQIFAPVQDKDINFLGNDGGSTITALSLDMSLAGEAKFNGNIRVPGEINLAGSTTFSIDLKDHGDYTWFRNASNRWVFQGGASGDDWTQTFTLRLESVGSGYNDKWAYLGQQNNNGSSGGKYKGVRIVKSTGSNTVVDGDFQAGATTVSDLTVTGDLTITGDINSYNVTDLDVTDKTITIGKGQTEANSGGSGIIVDGSSASILWDEGNNTWDLNKALDVAGNITSTGTLTINGNSTLGNATSDVTTINGGTVLNKKAASGTNIAIAQLKTADGSTSWVVGGSNTGYNDFMIWAPDLGAGNYFQINKSTANATFGGTIGSGAITSTGKITGTELDINGAADISGETTFKPKHYAATDDLNSDTRTIFSTHSVNNATSNRPINYSSVYTLGGSTGNALQISTNEDYSESGMWIRQYNQNNASPQGTGWQNWAEVWTTNHATLGKIPEWNAAYTYSQVAHLPLAGGTMTGAIDFGNVTGRAITITGDGNLDNADASIYLGNTPTSYGWDIKYLGSGSGNDNKLQIISTNAGTPVTALSFTQDGNATFAGTVTANGTTLTGATDISGLVTKASSQTISGAKTFSVQPTFNSDILVNGHVYGRAVDGQSSRAYRFGGMYFTWDSDSYGTNDHHSIRSTYGNSFTDSITLNSFNHIRFNIDSNDNNATSYFEVGDGVTDTSNVIFRLDQAGNATFTGDVTIGKAAASASSGSKSLIFTGVDDNSTETIGAKIFTVDSTNNPKGQDLSIQVAGDNGTLFTAMQINSNGFVGMGITGGSINNSLHLADNYSLGLGTGSDLTLVHSGTAGVINNKTGHLYIKSTQTDGDIIFEADNAAGSVTQYYRIDGGASLNVFSKDIFLGDSKKALFGSNSDLQIYHNATDSVIENVTGDLYITNKADDKDIVFRSDNGSGGFTTYFFLDGSNSHTNFQLNARWVDNAKAQFGNSGDLQIYHDGSHSIIADTGTGDLYLRGSSQIRLQGANQSNMLIGNESGSIHLYHNNSEKFQTTSTGISVTGGAALTGQVEVALASNQIKLSTGTSGDGYLNIGHFSNGTFIGTYGDDGGAADLLRFGVHSGDVALTINSNRSATFAGNVTVAGDGTGTVVFKVDANGDVGLKVDTGNANYLFGDSFAMGTGNFLEQTGGDSFDFKLFDSGTTTTHFQINPAGNFTRHKDNVQARFGDGNDLKIYHDGSNSYIQDSGTGSLIIKGSNTIAIRSADDENYLHATSNGSVKLYHNNSSKIETTSTGVTVTGKITSSSVAYTPFSINRGVQNNPFGNSPGNALKLFNLVGGSSMGSAPSSAGGDSNWVAPGAGRIRSITIRNVKNTPTSGNTRFKIYKNGSNTYTSNYITPTSGGVQANQRIQLNDINHSFANLDRIQIGFQGQTSSTDWEFCALTIVYELTDYSFN